jgi:predicted PurR-regulated permease PerM
VAGPGPCGRGAGARFRRAPALWRSPGGWWQQTLATPEAIDRLSLQARHLHFASGERILGLVAHRVLLISFMLLTLFFLLRDGARVAHALRIGTRRAFGEAGVRVADQAMLAVRGTVNGLIIIGLAKAC